MMTAGRPLQSGGKMKRQAQIWWPAVLTVIAVLVARYLWIEPAAIGQTCDGDGAPWWCWLRQGLIMTFAFKGLGYAAIVLGVFAVFSRSRRAALMGVCVSIAGLALYCFELSAVGLMLSVLTLARVTQAPQAPVGEQHPESKQHA